MYGCWSHVGLELQMYWSGLNLNLDYDLVSVGAGRLRSDEHSRCEPPASKLERQVLARESTST